MKNKFLLPSLFFLVMSCSSCQLVADVFKASAWVGILIVVVLLAVLIWAIAKFAD